MNKMLRMLIPGLILSSYSIMAEDVDPFADFGGFVGDNRSEVILSDYICEYCAEVHKWEFQIDTHLGIMDDDIYHFGNYTGVEGDGLFYSGKFKFLDGEGGYWKTAFQNVGLASSAVQSSYGKKGSYAFKLDYLNIPIRKYDQLVTPFVNPGSNALVLGNNWSRSDNATQFSNMALYSPFSLGTDWERLGLSFNASGDSNFVFNTSYRRLEKEGIREFSATQMLSATYLPFPVDQVTEDFGASIDYTAEKWYASFAVKISRFDNVIDSVTYETPFTPLVAGSDFSSMSTAPDNLATKLILNARYYYAPKSSMKIRYSKSKLTQDDDFLPYTTNLNLLTALPQANLNAEVDTSDVTFLLQHWFSSEWSLMAKYRDRERDNKTEQLLFQPAVTDLYIASQMMNVAYDFSKRSIITRLDYHPFANHLLSLTYSSDDKTRNYQTIHKTTEDGFTAKYRASLSEDFVLMIKAEQMNRDGSAPEIIDFLSVTENPLMQRYNVSDREQNKVNFQMIYNPIANFSTSISGYFTEQDYKKTEIGLTDNVQQNLNINFAWEINKDVNATLFMEKEKNETDLVGSNNFSSPNWYANNLDEVNSYGMSLSIKELMDSKLDITFDFNRSDADTIVTLDNNGSNDLLPEINSLWSQAALKFRYLYSDDLNFSFSYQYQKFESNDFTIDGVIPGSLTNLVTFGALSNNFTINYLLLSVSYQF